MVSVSLGACSSIDVWLKHTVFNGSVGRETEMGLMGYSVGLRGRVGSTFSREQ
jgi:hypothetical protein